MPAGADWVMYGPESDRAMGLRNVLAFGIGRALGGMGWQPRTRYAEVFLVQASRHQFYCVCLPSFLQVAG